ncbi:anion exchange protein 2, partial [Clonorchis sinensis]
MVNGDNVGPLRLARGSPQRPEELMSELSVRTLTGLEWKELNRIRRRMQRSSGQRRNSQDTDVGSEKNAVELKSHRFFELPGTRRRLCTRFHKSFMTPQRSWSVLEQAATLGPDRPHVVASPVVRENIGPPGPRTKVHRVSRAARRMTRKDASFSVDAALNPGLGHVVENNQSPSQGFGEPADAFPDADVFASKLSTLRLLRADGDPLDYLPPLFVELDILTCPGPETGSAHPDQASEQSVPSRHPSHWLETARWVRYEEDLDPLAGNFGQAHSPPLTFHAVVECRRYLEQGAIVLQSKTVGDQPPPSKLSQSHLHAAGHSGFAELDSAMHVLRNDCGATIEDVASIWNALQLRHHHVCDLPHQPLELSSNWLASRSQGLQFSRAVTSIDLQRPHNAGDGKRTASVPTLRVLNATTVQPSHRSSVIPIGQRALSLLHRALTPNGTERPSCTPPVQPRDRLSPDIQQQYSEVTPSVVRAPGEDTELNGYHLRVPSSKHPSDLEGRLSPSTEVVSVQVGVLPGLRTPLLVFLRLHRSLFIPDFTELSDSYPVRFVVLFLGPDRRHLDYGEVGRVLATMMVDKAFRSVAYTASCRDDLLDGLRVFLDTTIVVPLLSDITPRSLLAMHDQIRLFRHSRQLGDVHRLHKARLTRPTKRSRSRSRKARAGSHHKRSAIDSTHSLAEPERKVSEHHTSVGMNTAASPGQSFHPVEAAAAVRRKHLSPDHLQNVPRTTSETNVDCNFHPPGEPIDGCCPRASLLACSERSDCVHRRKIRRPSYESLSSSCGSDDDRPSVPSHCTCTCDTWTGCWTSLCSFRFGSALCTDFVAYRHRFYSDLVEPFGSGDCAAVGSLFSTVIFLYFVVLAPALTFGALLNSTVSEDFSIPLCIFASGISQCLFTVLGGQPLLIVGITGPMLILETCIKLVCEVHQVPFLLMRLLIACYTTVLGLVAVIANAGWLVLRVRRSVEEVFNFFVSFYFVFKAMKNLFGELLNTATASRENSLEQLNTSNTSHQWTAALTTTLEDQLGHHYAKTVTTLLLAFLMLFICLWLQSIKRGRYFRRTVRNIFGYLNVPIGLAITVCANSLLFPGIRASTIQIPTGNRSFLFLVTSSPILASSEVTHAAQKFLGSPKFHGLAFLLAACLVPAIATDTMLSGITVAKAERRLRKPCLFSLDLTVTLCLLPLVSSLLGWPFLSPAAVRSNAHAIALTKWNTRTPPGVPH